MVRNCAPCYSGVADGKGPLCAKALYAADLQAGLHARSCGWLDLCALGVGRMGKPYIIGTAVHTHVGYVSPMYSGVRKSDCSTLDLPPIALRPMESCLTTN